MVDDWACKQPIPSAGRLQRELSGKGNRDMESGRFDRLIGAFGEISSRRQALRLLTAGGAAAVAASIELRGTDAKEAKEQ